MSTSVTVLEDKTSLKLGVQAGAKSLTVFVLFLSTSFRLKIESFKLDHKLSNFMASLIFVPYSCKQETLSLLKFENCSNITKKIKKIFVEKKRKS